MDVQMTDEELMDKAVDALVNAFIVMFRSVGYPVRPLYYSEGGITQGEIVNILLKIKNSFLPTKQILIGL